MISNKREDEGELGTLVLGSKIRLPEFISVARRGAKVSFSQDYCARVEKSRALVERWIEEGRIMYGITTGFGALCTQVITPDETAQLQRNIILSHATSVGEPLSAEEVRGTLLMMLQNLGQGYSGVRLETLEHIKEFLNRGLTPFAPREGSVGYLSPEAHMSLVLIGEGQAYVEGCLMSGRDALEKVGLKPIVLSSKEGLALVSGTTSVTALGALALNDLLNAVKAADIIGAMSLEVLKGTIKAFDPRLMGVRPHPEQKETAESVRRILWDSERIRANENVRLQDALSLRCIPQLHGAAKKTLNDALRTLEIEMNSCCDNPIIWPEGDDGMAISGCNADSSYVGMAMDTACIAGTVIAKMSERRNNRLGDGSWSGYPWFVIRKPGLNSGMMIPQYTQAGLLNDMKILSHPATVDAIPTCGNQEDYVAMGYNASKKARQIAEKLEYVLAIELLSVYQAQQFTDDGLMPGTVSQRILTALGASVPVIEEDIFLYPHIQTIREFIHSARIMKMAE